MLAGLGVNSPVRNHTVVRRPFPELAHPIVQAPLAGGPSTPALGRAAVSGAGGLGFVAAGYKTSDAVRADIAATRALISAPFGVNLFMGPRLGPTRAGSTPERGGRCRPRQRPRTPGRGLRAGTSLPRTGSSGQRFSPR
jgi:hypothetical protein